MSELKKYLGSRFAVFVERPRPAPEIKHQAISNIVATSATSSFVLPKGGVRQRTIAMRLRREVQAEIILILSDKKEIYA
jgi:hypothetical protein